LESGRGDAGFELLSIGVVGDEDLIGGVVEEEAPGTDGGLRGYLS
jgi:hypothetical protein